MLVQPLLLGLLFQYIWIPSFWSFSYLYKASNAASRNILMDKPIEIFAR